MDLLRRDAGRRRRRQRPLVLGHAMRSRRCQSELRERLYRTPAPTGVAALADAVAPVREPELVVAQHRRLRRLACVGRHVACVDLHVACADLHAAFDYQVIDYREGGPWKNAD